MDPYRAPQVPPDPRASPPWRDRAGAVARASMAVALPIAVGWVVTMGVRRAPCGVAPASYLRLLWGAPGVALACSIGVAALLLSGARLSSRR